MVILKMIIIGHRIPSTRIQALMRSSFTNDAKIHFPIGSRIAG